MEEKEFYSEVIIIGGGPAGIGAALKLKEHDIGSLILEA